MTIEHELDEVAGGGGLDTTAYLDGVALGTWLDSPSDDVSFYTGNIPTWWSSPPSIAELNGSYHVGKTQDTYGDAVMAAGTHHWSRVIPPNRWDNAVGIDSLGELVCVDGGWLFHYDPDTNTDTYGAGFNVNNPTELVERKGTTEVIIFDFDGVKVYDYEASTLNTVDATGYNAVGAGYDPVDDVIRGVRDIGYADSGINSDTFESFVWNPATQSEVQSGVIMSGVSYNYSEFGCESTDTHVVIPLSNGISVLNQTDETWTEYTGWSALGYGPEWSSPAGAFVKNGIAHVLTADNNNGGGNTAFPILISRDYQ